MRIGSMVISAWAAALFFAAVPAAQAQDEPAKAPAKGQAAPAPAEKSGSILDSFYLEMAPEFSTGQFGAPLRSVLMYFPATLGFDYDGIAASLTVPFEIERAGANVAFVGGKPVRVGGSKGNVNTVAGLGDLILDAGYYFFEEHDGLPSLFVGGELKCPTANVAQGLGTGSFDEMIRVSSSITFFSHLKASLSLGYEWIGQPTNIPVSTLEYHNTIVLGAGAGYAFTKSNELWARYDLTTRIATGTPAFQLLSAEWDHYFSNDDKLFISVGMGLSSSAPALMLTVGYQIWF